MNENTKAQSRTVAWTDPSIGTAMAQRTAGIDLLRGMADGTVPHPPIAVLLGFTVHEADACRVAMRMVSGEHLYNPIGTVHGGALATLLDSVMGCAVHTTLPAGRSYTTLEIKVNYIRAITEASGELTAEGRVVHAGRRSAVAEGTIKDAQGRLYATGTATCLIFDSSPA